MKFILVGLVMVATSVSARLPAVGQKAPAFTVTTFDGRRIALADLRGKVVVLNFWATWCGPCREELPLLDIYYKSHRTAGLEVVAVTSEDSVPLSQLVPLAAAVAFPMARHFKGNYGRLDAVPTNFVIDRAGVLRYGRAGAFDLDGLNRILVPLLREDEPPVMDDTLGPTATE